MADDKRTVATDALETLGMVHTKEEHRDAIHLAVLPVTAGGPLKAGDPIIIQGGIAYYHSIDNLGIVDPFLEAPLKKGDRFWFVLKPRLVQSLRHVWEHPAFPDTETTPIKNIDRDKHDAYIWITEYAQELSRDVEEGYDPVTADELIAAALSHEGDGWGDYITRGGTFEGMGVVDEFWNKLEVYTGDTMKKRNSFFSCSC